MKGVPMKTIRNILVVIAVSLVLMVGCDNAANTDEPQDEPSTITLEKIQMAQPLSGGIFDSGYTLTRTLRDYPPEGEDNVFGQINNWADTHDKFDDDHFVISIYGFARDDHPYIESFTLRVPADTPGTYTYDPETDTSVYPEDITLRLKTNYGVWFTAGEDTLYDSPLSVTISEITDRWIEGGFTAELLYFNVEALDNGANRLTIDEEISFTRQPVINGTFRVYRSFPPE